MEQKETIKDKNIQDLQRFLKQKAVKEIKEVKPEPMNFDEMEIFFNQKIIPAFKTLKKEMSDFNFDRLDHSLHTKMATFKVIEELSHFIFRVEIDNLSREIKIYPQLKYRKIKRGKLTDANLREIVKISFNNLEKVTENKIISLFTTWIINKEEFIKTSANKL